MGTATLSLSVAKLPFPVGTADTDHVTITVTGSAAGSVPVIQNVPFANIAEPVAFANLGADTYAYSIVNFDAAGNSLGSAVTGSFTIAVPTTVLVSVVTGATVATA